MKFLPQQLTDTYPNRNVTSFHMTEKRGFYMLTYVPSPDNSATGFDFSCRKAPLPEGCCDTAKIHPRSREDLLLKKTSLGQEKAI